MFLGAFFGFGLQKASFSIGLYNVCDMAEQHFIYSENIMFSRFGISVDHQSGTSNRGFGKLPGDGLEADPANF